MKPSSSPRQRIADANARQRRLADLEQVVVGGSGDPIYARETADAAQRAVAEAEARLASLKVAAKDVKRDIADWKGWFDALPPDRQADERAKLALEVARLGADLAALESEIGPAVVEVHRLVGQAVSARARQEGLHDEGERAVPRIRSVIRRKMAEAERIKKRATAEGGGGS